jgi:hypothetical protein
MQLLNALQWKFLGRDHARLLELEIFKKLRVGNGSRKNLIKRQWGKFMQRLQRDSEEAPNDFCRELLQTFEHFFLLSVSRLVDSGLGKEQTLKTSGTSLPKLERAKSVVNVDVSERLMNSSFEVLFKEVDRYVNMLRMHKGIDWSTYV